MTERFASDLVIILVVLIIAALLGFIIGWFCRRIRKARFEALESEKFVLEQENQSIKKENLQLKNDMVQLKGKLDECLQQNENNNEKKSLFNAAAAREAFNTQVVENDLKIIEGIGEKIESLLNKRGINTWHQLSQTSPDTIKDILLEEGGPNYRIHEPKTWPEQARMAYEGKWTELKVYQDYLTAGK
jgi:predicted flap endonuclease-1-like 5' DNA nuclease